MNVLLADDHKVVREGIRFFLERLAPDVSVLEAADLPRALDVAAEADHLDLVILDLIMPGMNGLSGLEVMRRRCPGTPVVVLSGSVRRRDALNAIRSGAAGYIPKTMSGDNMIAALRLVVSGETYLPSLLAANGDGNEENGGFPKNSPLQKFTPRERDVMRILVKGCSNKEIARRLGLQEISVKVHLTGIFRKLGVANRTQAVRAAMELGWDL